MTAEHFQSQIQRLSNVFGGAYKTERTQLIWREMQNLPEDSFSRIVDRLIAECRQAPLLPEFREFAAAEREKLWAKRKSNVVNLPSRVSASCSTCKDTGTILARRKDDCTPWAFKCVCGVGRNNPRAFPEWLPSHELEVV